MWWGHTLVRRNTWSLLVLLNALFLATLTICNEVWRADKLWQSLLCILGVEIFVPMMPGISLYEYIISICYPLSFIRKVENIAIIYKAFLPMEEHTRLLPLIRRSSASVIDTQWPFVLQAYHVIRMELGEKIASPPWTQWSKPPRTHTSLLYTLV